MMSMSMSLTCSCEMIIGLKLAGGTSQTVFPRVEKMLEGSSFLQKAVAHVELQDNEWNSAENYRSFMDYLVCSIFPEVRPLCMNYYWRDGLPLRDQITFESRDKMEWLIIGALEAASIAFKHEHTVSWDRIRVLLECLGTSRIVLYPEGAAPLEELAEVAA